LPRRRYYPDQGDFTGNVYFSAVYLYAPQGGFAVEIAANSPGLEKDEGEICGDESA